MGQEMEMFRIRVDYGRRVEERIQAGHYRWFHPEVTSRNFPAKRTGRAELFVAFGWMFDVDPSASADHIIQDSYNDEWRPADLQELVAFGDQYSPIPASLSGVLDMFAGPEGGRLVALDSLWKDGRGVRYAPGLAWDERGAFDVLDLCLLETNCLASYLFLSIRR